MHKALITGDIRRYRARPAANPMDKNSEAPGIGHTGKFDMHCTHRLCRDPYVLPALIGKIHDGGSAAASSEIATAAAGREIEVSDLTCLIEGNVGFEREAVRMSGKPGRPPCKLLDAFRLTWSQGCAAVRQ